MTSALIVVDVQESFRQRPLWRTVSQPDVVARVDQLVRWARARGDLVVWVLHSEPGTGGVFDPARGYVRVVDELSPSPTNRRWSRPRTTRSPQPTCSSC